MLTGWKVVLSQRVPKLTTSAVPSMFDDLVATVPELVEARKYRAADYDWALHPGGATIISGIQKVMRLTEDHLRASYEVYIAHGNSSSATIFSVLKQLLSGPTNEHIIGCAFGPGISIEMMAFKRMDVSRGGSLSPAETLVAEDVD